MNKTQRKSGVELLRLICMFLIVAHHFSVHGGFSFAFPDDIGFASIFVDCLSMFGRSSCAVFVLATSYFLISSSSQSIELAFKKVFHLEAEMFFYCLLWFALNLAFNWTSLSIVEILQSLLSPFYGYWFVIAYCCFLPLTPFLNRVVCKSSRRDHLVFCILSFLIWSFFPTISNNYSLFSSFDMFLVMYVIGAYLGRFNPQSMSHTKANAVITILLFFGIIIWVILFDWLALTFNVQKLTLLAVYFLNFASVPSFFLAIFSFEWFNQMNFNSPFINQIAKSSLGVYLIHDNTIGRFVIWQYFFPNVSLLSSSLFPLYAIIKILIVFFGCLLIDQVRLLTVDKLFTVFNNRYFDNIYTFITKPLRKHVDRISRDNH